MPGRYFFESGLLRLTFEGETPLSAVEGLLDEALSDPACPPRPYILSDLRGSTSVSRLSGDEMKQAVDVFAARREQLGGKSAVVTQAGVQFGVMRMGSAYSEFADLELRVFESEATALEWLLAA